MIFPFCHTIDSSDQTDFFDGEKYAVASFEKDVALLKFVQTFLYCQQTSIVPNFRRNWTFQIVPPQAIKLSRGLRCSGNLWESVLNCIATVAVCVWANQGSLVTQFGRRRLCGNVIGLSGSRVAEVGSLLARGKMATKVFVRRVVGIAATNALFFCVIA